jgi:hypothetical protein
VPPPNARVPAPVSPCRASSSSSAISPPACVSARNRHASYASAAFGSRPATARAVPVGSRRQWRSSNCPMRQPSVSLR